MKVFLSSTAQDLVAYRQVADDTILRLSQEVVSMERFGPLPGEPVAECERKARESDVVVCIVAHRYGFVPEKGRRSITQREVEAAKAAGKDILVWIVADNHPWSEKKEQDLLTDPTVLADPARVVEVAEGVAALIAFKAWLSKTFIHESFTTPDDLAKKIAIALANRSRKQAVSTPKGTSPKIFMSYRREDSGLIAAAIHEKLAAQFGAKNVFMDVETIPAGRNFRDCLHEAVGDCDLLLALIGERWLDARDELGGRRLEQETDWVRVELEAAFVRRLPVVPLLLGSTRAPSASDLPESLKELSYCQALPLRGARDFAHDLETLGLEIERTARLPRVKTGDVRIIHALQPAPHFHGREALVTEMTDWVADLTSPDRVWSLVAAGGTGKTAVVERVVSNMKPAASVLVWSFYEKPDTNAFLRECNQLFLGEEAGPAGGRLERLERGLRDGRPHLVVLDGLERVQEDVGAGRVRGELSDQTLKLLLRALASGLGRARALVTSRFPLVDLQDWSRIGYRETRLDDLIPEAAVAVLRGWGVVGDDETLYATAAQVGHHALSVAVIGSYLRSFANGRVEEVASFDLDTVTGEDPRAAKLARVLGSYAERLPPEERELLARVSVFPRGVTLDLLGNLIDAGGKVAGLLVNAKPRLSMLVASLKARGLVFEYRSDASVTVTAHPFLREKFRRLLGVPSERVFDVVAQSLGTGLEKRPQTMPTDPSMLDRYERLIEATRLAGREQEAFDLFWYGMGGHSNLGFVLGEYQRGHRILAAFSPTGKPEDLGPLMAMQKRSLLANELALFGLGLGRLTEAWRIRQVDDKWTKALGDAGELSMGLQNSSTIAFARGNLKESHALASAALGEAKTARSREYQKYSLAYRAIAAHARGDMPAARADFATITEKYQSPVTATPDFLHAVHLLDLGHLGTARAHCDRGIETARAKNWRIVRPWFHTLLARIDLLEGNNPTRHIDEIRAQTSQTGQMEYIIEAHLLTARYLLSSGDPQAALGEAETGLLHAVACGYGLIRIELLVVMARIRLAWPDAPKAIQAAREALDLATHPDCQYAWGEADAAQVWGEAYFANNEPTLAKRAFTQALKVRKRIEHPGVAETKKWLARTG